MNPDTLVALPTITAAQRQLLISVLENAQSDARQAGRTRDVEYASRLTELAQALDLHKDAVRASAPGHDPALTQRLYDAARTRGTVGNADLQDEVQSLLAGGFLTEGEHLSTHTLAEARLRRAHAGDAAPDSTLPEACMAGVCTCPSTPDGDDQHHVTPCTCTTQGGRWHLAPCAWAGSLRS